MLKAIVTWALQMRVLVVALSVALLVVGIQSARHAPLDVFPEFAPPMAEIQTEAPGLSTEQVDDEREHDRPDAASRHHPAAGAAAVLDVSALPSVHPH